MAYAYGLWPACDCDDNFPPKSATFGGKKSAIELSIIWREEIGNHLIEIDASKWQEDIELYGYVVNDFDFDIFHLSLISL